MESNNKNNTHHSRNPDYIAAFKGGYDKLRNTGIFNVAQTFLRIMI